jgi:hypothetical protein
LYGQFSGQLFEIGFESGTDHQAEMMDVWVLVEAPPSVCHDGKPGDLEEQFVDARTHPGSSSCSHDDGGVHGEKARPRGRAFGA